MGCICVGLGANDTRCDLNASSTVGPALETGLGAAREESKVERNALGLVRASSAHSSLSRLGSIWILDDEGTGALIESP